MASKTSPERHRCSTRSPPPDLAQFEGKTPIKAASYDYPAPVVTDPNQPASALNFKDPLQFWELLSVAMNENPPPQDQITALLPSFKPLGIELGKKWDRSQGIAASACGDDEGGIARSRRC